MKKFICLFLSIMLTMSITGTVVAEGFDVSDYVNPFSETRYTERDFDGSGKILIIRRHSASIIWREPTAKDFPRLEIESVGPDSPMSDDQDFRETNSQYREVIWIVLKDKSNKAVIDAMQYLYDSKHYYYAAPQSQVRPMGDVNGDYRTNLTDASHILKHIAGWENFILDYNDRYFADVCFDDIVTLSDVTVLLKFLAGWEQYVNSPIFYH